MRLLIDPDPPSLRWCKDGSRGLRTGRGALDARWPGGAERGSPPMQVTSVSHRLHHGGGLIRQPVTRVTPKTLDEVREAVRWLPEHNGLTYAAMRRTLREFPDAPQFLMCDTAYFIDLPAAASAYAVPSELNDRGVRRYGGCGLLHQWAWERSREICGQALPRLISIQLGDHPNLAAIKFGRPVDTTIGFTPVEGIPSHTGCGDIDASVVFELHSSGMSLSEINELLSARSGFRALAGKRCDFQDLLIPDDDAGRALARRILIYDLVRQVGAFAAALGGLDAVAFAAEEPARCVDLLIEICAGLKFLDLRCRSPQGRDDAEVFSEGGSGVKAVVLKDDAWRIMARRAQAAEKEG